MSATEAHAAQAGSLAVAGKVVPRLGFGAMQLPKAAANDRTRQSGPSAEPSSSASGSSTHPATTDPTSLTKSSPRPCTHTRTTS